MKQKEAGSSDDKESDEEESGNGDKVMIKVMRKISPLIG